MERTLVGGQLHKPDYMQPVINIFHFRPPFDEVFHDINLVTSPSFETLGVVCDQFVISLEDYFCFYVMDTPLIAYRPIRN
jgi:hypothetical protein